MDKTHFKQIILDQIPIIDVRAPIEFLEGAIPGSVNLPVMNNEERAQVGTIYKRQGQAAAIALGQQLVSGEIKEQRIKAWQNYILQKPEAVITCFRGGLRSKISQEWIFQAGISRPRIEGGYKAFRNFLIEETLRFSERDSGPNGASPDTHDLLVVSGATGSGKTALLRELAAKLPILDLEKMANHRGSAFGGFASPQPNQTNFENELACALIRLDHQIRNEKKFVLVEDESRLVGTRAIPPSFFELMRNSPLVLIEETLEVRTENTYREYVLRADSNKTLLFESFKNATKRISKKLGGLRAQELLKNMDESIQEYEKSGSLESNKIWIKKLLEWYYDPMYLGSLERRNPKIIFKGTREEVQHHLILSR